MMVTILTHIDVLSYQKKHRRLFEIKQTDSWSMAKLQIVDERLPDLTEH